MRLPHYQISDKFLTVQAPLVAGLLRIPLHAAWGLGMGVFAFAVDLTSTTDKPPDGVLLDSEAGALLEAAVGWAGPSGAMVGAFVRAGLIERLELGGLRVKGTDRYVRTWEKNRRRNRRDGTTGVTCAGSGAQPAETAPGDGDGDGDGEEDLEAHAGGAPAEQAEMVPQPAPEDLQAVWNSFPELPRWRFMPDKRRKAAQLRLRERGMDGPEGHRAVLAMVAASPFCTGGGDRGWKADPDWYLRPDTAAKVLEGKYSGTPGKVGTGGGFGKPPANLDAGRRQARACDFPRCGVLTSDGGAVWGGYYLCSHHFGDFVDAGVGSEAAAHEWIRQHGGEAA